MNRGLPSVKTVKAVIVKPDPERMRHACRQAGRISNEFTPCLIRLAETLHLRSGSRISSIDSPPWPFSPL